MKMFPEKIRELSKRLSSLVEWWKKEEDGREQGEHTSMLYHSYTIYYEN